MKVTAQDGRHQHLPSHHHTHQAVPVAAHTHTDARQWRQILITHNKKKQFYNPSPLPASHKACTGFCLPYSLIVNFNGRPCNLYPESPQPKTNFGQLTKSCKSRMLPVLFFETGNSPPCLSRITPRLRLMGTNWSAPPCLIRYFELSSLKWEFWWNLPVSRLNRV